MLKDIISLHAYQHTGSYSQLPQLPYCCLPHKECTCL